MICGVVGLVFVLLLLAVIIYVVRFRNVTSQPRILACNGNGHITSKQGTGPGGAMGLRKGLRGGQGDTEGHEMEVYVPMLTQIPPDFKSPPLDTKVMILCVCACMCAFEDNIVDIC